MTKINTFLKNNVANVSIGFGVIGILAHLFTSQITSSKLINSFSIIHLQDPFRNILYRLDAASSINFLSILLLVMLIVGGFHYKKSNKKDSRLLKFGLSTITIQNILSILFTPINYIVFSSYAAQRSSSLGKAPTISEYLLPLLITIPLFYVSFYLVRWLNQQYKLPYQGDEMSHDKKQFSFSKVKNSTRLAHMVFDYFLALLIIWPFVTFLISVGSAKLFPQVITQFLNGRWGYSFSILFSSFIYYLIFEGLFQTSPVKYITGTRVVNASTMESPGFGKIFIRTLCRRIPFEPFSFFGQQGWHDSISGTEVIAEKKDGHVKFNLKIWIGLLFFTYLFSIGFSITKNRLNEKRGSEFYISATKYQDNSKLENLNKGDLLFIQKPKAIYKDDQEVIVVGSISENEVTGIHYVVNNKKQTSRLKYLQKGIGNAWYSKGQVSIDKAQLFGAFRNKINSQSIQINDVPYLLKNIEDIDNPIFETGSASYRNGESSHSVRYDVCAVEILSIETLEGNVKWKLKLPMTTSFIPSNSKGSFQLKLEDKPNKTSKSKMKVRYCGKESNYIIFKHDYTVLFAKEIAN